MGGRRGRPGRPADSTNIVDGEVAVVTNIGLEHTEVLGSTRASIAGEKAGILKPGAILVTTLAADDEAGRVAHARAQALGCDIVVTDAGEGATIEETNVALAGAVLDALGGKGVTIRAGARVGAALLDSGTRARARLVGRMERLTLSGRVRPLHVVLDGAHVPFNIAAVLSDLSRAPELAGPCVAVVALARDKDARGFLTELAKRASAIVATNVPSATRGLAADELQAIAASLGIASEVEPDPRLAFWRGAELAETAGAWLLVTGSLYLVGALRGDAVASGARLERG